ncbi:MAG: response regulator, partial [Saprospiraceae bacterium]|nr:response regulator [Saprospiraceae bacterium]
YFAYDYHQDKRRKEVESKRLKELDRVKNNMYTNITHEFRTPLTLILGYIEELNNKMEDEAERGLLNNIGENSQRLLKMVNDILELSKLEGSKVTLHLEQDDLVVYLRYLIDRFQPLAQNNHIDLSFISHDHHVVMDFDRERLGSIIINLISNAIRAVGLDGRITVELRKQQRSSEPHACIVVRDNGIGIPKEDLPLIFQKYYQVETDKMVPGTTGIGLALVYDLVSLMQGSISVESDDQGTIFTILLPMTNDAPTVQYEDDLVDRSPVVEVGDRSLILLIEDNKDLAKFIKRVLSRSYDVIYAVNGADGLSLAQERLPDLIVSDVMMPDIDGYQVCQQLKNDLKTDHIPVILLTAKAGQENKNYAISLGADAYIIKPFSQDELLLRIHQLIEIRNKLAEKFGGGLMEVMSSNKMDKQSIFIRRVVGCINEHMEDADFGVSQLAQKLSLSESQLYRKIKSLSGKSTAIFIRSVRLEKAKVMLEGGDVGVSEVAYATGFNDPSWFSRAFKKEFGIVPSLVTQGDDD